MLPLLLLVGGITVELPAESHVKGIELTLGSIATVTGEDPAQVERARNFVLGNAPTPGYSRLFRSDRVEQRLRAAFPDLELQITGASTCRVQPRTVDVSGQEVMESARSALAGLFGSRSVEIVPRGAIADFRVVEGDRPVELRPRMAEAQPRPGDWSVPVEVLVDGQPYRSVWTTWSVDYWVRRPVLLRDVLRGETIDASAIEIQRVRTSQAASDILAGSLEALAGAQAARDMVQGAVVNRRDVMRPTVLRRGEYVNVEIRRGAVTVRSMATAAQDARIGDRVRVKVQSTGRELTGVLVSRERVEIRID